VTLYTRRQLALLLLLVAVAGLGLAVQHWRRAYPLLAERLERWDRAPADDDEARAWIGYPPRRVSERSPGPVSACWERGAPGVGSLPTPCAPLSTSPGEPLDLNRADLASLMRLPGVSALAAARLIEARARDGPFASVDAAGRAARIRRATLERLRPLVSVGTQAR